jgi:uncharacterized membrane protein (DUF4010 family)
LGIVNVSISVSQSVALNFVESPILGLAVALALGLLVGLQREYASKRIGIRSFALISIIGSMVGLFAAEHGAWLLASGLLALTIAILSHTYLVSRTSGIAGMTTELAAIAMFLVGALATSGNLIIAVVLGGAVMLLLQWKTPMHSWVDRIGAVELGAIARFVLITLVILPILPNIAYGPYSVLNPRQIWLMVVLIVSLNLAGFVALKFAIGKGGALLSGVLGGLISSTATTVSFSTKGRSEPSLVPLSAIVILVASALVYIRIIVEVGVVAGDLLPEIAGPIAAFMGIFVTVIGVHLIRYQPVRDDIEEPKNPAELKSAMSFALLYGLVLFISAAANEYFGQSMLYPVALVSGLTDVDAITLSIGRLFSESRIDSDVAWRVIFVASLSNLAFKAGIVAVLSGARLRRRLLPVMASMALLGFVGVWLWP